jgi:hypothetical protein
VSLQEHEENAPRRFTSAIATMERLFQLVSDTQAFLILWRLGFFVNRPERVNNRPWWVDQRGLDATTMGSTHLTLRCPSRAGRDQSILPTTTQAE